MNSNRTNQFKLENIYPPLRKEIILEFLDEYKGNNDFLLPKDFSLKGLPINIKNLLNQVYITKTLKIKEALKARFLQYMQIDEFLSNLEIKNKNIQIRNDEIDYILYSPKFEKYFFVFIIDLFDKKELSRITSILIEYQKEYDKSIKSKKKSTQRENYEIEEIFLICGKIERQFARNLDFIEVNSKKIKISLFMEYTDPDRPFEDDEMIIIDDLKFFGFNFGSLNDLLSIIKKEKGRGRYTIYKENHQGFKNKVWEGLIFPRELMDFK